MADQDITNALKHFLADFNPKKILQIKVKEDNLLENHLNNGQPVLTLFEKHLLLEHLRHSISTHKFRRLLDIEKCLLHYIQSIIQMNYSSLKNISYLDSTWFKTFLRWAYPQIQCTNLSWLDIDQL